MDPSSRIVNHLLWGPYRTACNLSWEALEGAQLTFNWWVLAAGSESVGEKLAVYRHQTGKASRHAPETRRNIDSH